MATTGKEGGDETDGDDVCTIEMSISSLHNQPR